MDEYFSNIEYLNQHPKKKKFKTTIMNTREQLIWKYVEGTASDAEKKQIQKEWTDPEFRKECIVAREIHESLFNLPLSKAPSGLLARTMRAAEGLHPQYVPALRPLDQRPLFVFIGFLLAIGVVGYLWPVTSGESISYLPVEWMQYITKVQYPTFLSWDIPLGDYIDYIKLLWVLPFIYMIERLLNDRWSSLTPS